MNNIDAIIFDLDGTLWSAINNAVKVFEIVKKRHSEVTNVITKEDIEKVMGKSFDEVVLTFFPYLEHEKAIEIGTELFGEVVNDLFRYGGTLYPDLENVIKELSKKYKLLIVSNCVTGYIESFLKCSGLKDYFIDFECNGKTKLSKGNNIKLVMERNNIKNAVYVGDTKGDKEAATIANVPFVYAAYGFGQVEEYDYIINSISDLNNLDFNPKTVVNSKNI